MGGCLIQFTHKVVESVGDENVAPEALLSQASTQIETKT
jgi:hypothetical protein